jgi:hypothetical protein
MASLRARLAGIERHKLIFGAFSVLVTLIVMIGFLIENRWGYMKPDPLLIYVDSWQEGERTPEVAKAQQAKELAALKQAIAEQKAAEAAAAKQAR